MHFIWFLIYKRIGFFIYAKWTERKAAIILFLFYVCCVCGSVRIGLVNQTSATIATDSNFGKHVPRDGPDMPP